MTERSEILREHEVKAILENRLSLLVRPVKLNIRHRDKFAGFGSPGYRVGDHWYSETELIAKCPLGAPGDRLWGRETWHTDETDIKNARAQHEDVMGGSPIFYRADPINDNAGCVWKPSTQMPKWASRIWLENAGVRVARIQDISEEEAKKAGVIPVPFTKAGTPINDKHKEALQIHWDQDNPRYPYNSNPWVWLVGVRVLSANGRPV